MAAGMPILATRIPCHTDVMTDEACVFWAEDSSVECLAAALRLLWTERGSLARRGAAASQLAQHHTWAASAGKLARAFEHGLAGRAGSHG